MRILSFLFSATSLLLVGFCYLEWSYIGFPDGHMTDLDRALETIYPVYMLVGALFTLNFLYLGWQAASRKKILFSVGLFGAFLILLLLVNQYLNTNFDHGAGG